MLFSRCQWHYFCGDQLINELHLIRCRCPRVTLVNGSIKTSKIKRGNQGAFLAQMSLIGRVGIRGPTRVYSHCLGPLPSWKWNMPLRIHWNADNRRWLDFWKRQRGGVISFRQANCETAWRNNANDGQSEYAKTKTLLASAFSKCVRKRRDFFVVFHLELWNTNDSHSLMQTDTYRCLRLSAILF